MNNNKVNLYIFSFLKRIGNVFLKNYKEQFNSTKYWEYRYKSGGNSGLGSYSKLAKFKAEILNNFVDKHNINSVIEFGCGDGQQLNLFKFKHYIGFDVSTEAIRLCNKLFSEDQSKKFKHLNNYNEENAQLILSLDVIYHLVEDKQYQDYINRLFNASSMYVIIYSSNFKSDNNSLASKHVKHRKFTDWIDQHIPEFKLIKEIENKYPFNENENTGSFANFYIYEKTNNIELTIPL